MLLRGIFVISVFCESLVSQAHVLERWLESPRVTNYGDWGTQTMCPENSWVSGMDLKIEYLPDGVGDDTALNAIKLICTDLKGKHHGDIASSEGPWGHYRGRKHCNGFATGFQLRSEKPYAYTDKVAAVDLKATCTNVDGTTTRFIAGDILQYGNWTQEQVCPPKTAICGIVTQIEGFQGNQDDTALNNVDFACCKIPHPAESCSVGKSWQNIITCHEGVENCEMKFMSGLIETKQHSHNTLESSKFFEKLGYDGGLSFAWGVLQIKAQLYKETRSERINGKTMDYIIRETGFHQQEWSFRLGCVGTLQELVLHCGSYSLNTKEYRCVPDEEIRDLEENALFPPSGSVVWGINCDFIGGDILNKTSQADDCGQICLDNELCTHFLWTRQEGGTCFMKGNGVDPSAVEIYDVKSICGWVVRPEKGGSSQSSGNIMWKYNCDINRNQVSHGKRSRPHMRKFYS